MDLTAFLAAAAVVPFLAIALSWIVIAWRGASYRRQEDSRSALVRSRAAGLDMPDTWPASIDKRFDDLYERSKRAHERAVKLQIRYSRSLTAMVVSLVVSFTCTALSATILHDRDWFGRFAGYCELLAFALVLTCFFLGRWLNRQWIRARTFAELLRQHYYLAVFLEAVPGADVPPATEAAATAAAGSLAGDPVLSPRDPLAKQVKDIWRQRSRALRQRKYDGNPVDHMIAYVRHRAIPQEAWFHASRERLEGTEKHRSLVLLMLYLAACVLVVLKVFHPCLPPDRYHSTFLFALLAASGLSAAMTAFYVSQNHRSLMHRYRSQEERLSEIIGVFRSDLLSKLPDRQGPCRDADACATFARLVLELEAIMIYELIDWIHISSHDALELTA